MQHGVIRSVTDVGHVIVISTVKIFTDATRYLKIDSFFIFPRSIMARPKFSRKRARNPAWRTSVMKKSRVPRMFARNDVRYDRQVVESPTVGLGQGARTRIRTFGHVQVTFGATGIFAGFLKPGSCFDPFGDIAALQPNLFDIWKGVYGRYLVLSATVKVTVVSRLVGATATDALTIVGYPTLNSTAKTTLQDAASQPYARTTMYGGAGTEPKSLYFKLNHHKVLGKFGPLESLANGALTTADPTSGQFMVLPIFIQSTKNDAAPGQAVLEVEIVQDVWFDRRVNVNDVIE